MNKFRSRAVLATAAATFSMSMLAQVSFAGDPIMYEAFNYNVDELIVGQTNPGTGKQWLDPGSPTQPAPASDTQKILAGNASITNLPAAVGNQFNLPNTPNGNIARIQLPNAGGYTYDTATSTGNAPNGLFMSMAVTVAQDTAFSTMNYFAGFHLGAGGPPGNGMSVSNGYAGMIFLRPDPGNPTNYNFGVSKNNATGTVIGWSPQSIAPGETAFLAFQYQFNTAAANNDDTVNLWVNPDLTGPVPLGPSATTSTGFDGYTTTGTPPDQVTTSIIRSAYVRSNGTGLAPYGATPSNLYIDEVRVGLSYADVTPAATVYWDLNADTAGSGSATPTGTWDGATQTFNNNPTGEAGMFIASPASDQIVAFSAGSDATGDYSITISGTQKAASVKVAQGHVTLTGGTLSTNGFDVATGATTTVQSALTSHGGTITKIGDGKLQVTKLAQGASMNIAAGTVQVLDSTPTLPSHPSGDDAAVSQPKSLSITAGATLDLGNNDMIIDYSALTPYASVSPAADIEALIAQGFNAGDWLGTGITSSTAASEDAAGNFVLAIVDNALLPQPYGVSNGGENFDGIDVPLESVLVKFTHRVDINLDGLVTDADAIAFSTNYEIGAPATWSIGDLDYDGVFSENDAIIFGTYYDTGLAHLPEPATLSIVAVAGLALGRRRRKA